MSEQRSNRVAWHLQTLFYILEEPPSAMKLSTGITQTTNTTTMAASGAVTKGTTLTVTGASHGISAATVA